MRDLALLSAAFGLLFIGGQPQTGFVITISAILYASVRSLRAGMRLTRIGAGIVASLILGICLAAPQILPFLEYLRESAAGAVRGEYGSYGWKHYPWYALISWIMPRFFGDPREGNFWGFSSFLGESIYIGAIPAVFAIAAFLRLKKMDNFLQAAIAVFLFGCFGLYFRPLARLYLALPLLSSIDNNKLLAPVAFGLVSFSVVGLHALLTGTGAVRNIVSRWMWAASAWVALFGVCAWFFRDAIKALHLEEFQLREAAWLAGFLVAAAAILLLARAGRVSGLASAWLLLLVTLLDLFRVWIGYYPSFPERYLTPDSASVRYLRDHAGPHRVLALGDALPPEVSVQFGLKDMRGYDGMTPIRYFKALEKIDPDTRDLWRKLQLSRPPAGAWTNSTLFFRSLASYLDSQDARVIGAFRQLDYWSNGLSRLDSPALLSILGIRFVLNPKGAPLPAGAGFNRVHASDAEVWENPRVLPRAYIVTRPRFAADDKAALEAIAAAGFPFDTTAVITAPGQDAGGERKSELIPAEIQTYAPEEVVIRTAGHAGGWLILSDLYYPGWKATCDGSPRTIYPGNYLVRAVSVPAGDHTVRFMYQPESFRLGMILAAISAIMVLFGLVSMKK